MICSVTKTVATLSPAYIFFPEYSTYFWTQQKPDKPTTSVVHSCLRIIYYYKPLGFYFILFGDGDQTQALGILGKRATQVMLPTWKDLIEHFYSRLQMNFHSAVRDEAMVSPWPASFLPCDVGGTHDLPVGWMRCQ